MTSEDHINDYFEKSIQVKIETANILPPIISQAGQSMVSCLENGGKILICGNGGSASLANHFSSKLLNCFKMERPSLPAFALTGDVSSVTAISDTYGFENVFSRQIAALGNEKDILLAISSDGGSTNILRAIEEAHDLEMTVVALTGGDGGVIRGVYNSGDVELRVPSDDISNVQENHILIIHCLCDLIDQILFAGLEG
jgi:DnaA initiator-associating protein